MWRATLVGTGQGGILGAGPAAHRARPVPGPPPAAGPPGARPVSGPAVAALDEPSH